MAGLHRRPLCYVPVVAGDRAEWREWPDDGADHYARVYGSDGSYTVTHGRREVFESLAWYSPLSALVRCRTRLFVHRHQRLLLCNLSDVATSINGWWLDPRGALLVDPEPGWLTLKGCARFGVYVVGPGDPPTLQHVK